MKSRLCVLSLGVMLMGMTPVSADDEAVILNPGTLSGSVSLVGYTIKSVTVYAIDTVQLYSANVTANVLAGASSIDYTLTVEGNRDYYVMAYVGVSTTDTTYVYLPVTGPVNVPIAADVPWDMSMEPAIISGTISTGSSDNTIASFDIDAILPIVEFGSSYESGTFQTDLNVPGDTGRTYILLLAPGVECSVRALISVDGMLYYFYDDITAPAAGATTTFDYTIDVMTAATISGKALLQGIDVYSASVNGRASSPTRSSSSLISDVSDGLYALDVDEGTWCLSPSFSFHLPGDLNDLTGSLVLPESEGVTVNAGDYRTDVDFIVDPAFIHGTLNLWGANADFDYAEVRAYQSTGCASSQVDTETGDFLFICSPGDWRTDSYLDVHFTYPDDPDASLVSIFTRSSLLYDSVNLRTVAAGEIAPSVMLSYGTITVRRYFRVAGGGTLSMPVIKTKGFSPKALGVGAIAPRTEGQAVITLLLPGTYIIEASAFVNGSTTSFGETEITVDEGDVVVIGGTDRPTVQVTNPTNNEIISGNKVTVEGTVTDDFGIASITINGQEVPFDPTENPVHFSHEISLAVGENLITIVVADVDGTEPVVLTIPVTSETCGRLPDLAISAEDIQLLAYDAGDSTITINAAIHNVGTATASAFTVRFYEFNTLLDEAEVVEIPAGDTRSVPITIPMPAPGERLIQVVVDPLDTIEELDETNNEATRILRVNTGDITEGYILITGRVPFSVCSGSSFSVTGTAVYDLYVGGVRYTDYAVKGGRVEMTVIGPDGQQWPYGGGHTNIYGAFSQVLPAPGTLGIYRLLITVTDNTFIDECELVFEVKECSSSTPPPGPPYDGPGGGGGGGGGSGYWVPPGSGGGSSTEWTWVWTERPPGAPDSDVYVYSEDIHFSVNHPDPEQEITIFAEIHYWAQSTDLVAYNVPINIYATYPGEDKIKIGETLIDELTVGWPDGGSEYVFTTWKNHREGIYIIEVEVDPSYSEQNMLNNAATRAIIVGDLGHPWGAIEGQVREALGGVDDVIMDLYDADQMILIESKVTDHGGYYLFTNLPAGTYQVHIRVPDGYVADAQTKPAEVMALSITTVNFFLSQAVAPVADAGGPYSGEVGLPVTLDASGSYDPDGVIVSYEWDCNGDGVYDQVTSSSQMPYTWDTAYNGSITLRVTDDDGLTATDTAKVTITSPPAYEVGVDIYPNRVPNKVYLSTNYTIYVALLGAEEFAVTDVNSSTVRFGRNGTEASPVREPAIRDINADGFDDALYGFLTFDCGFALGDTTGTLTGQIAGEIPIAGSDSVSVLE